MTDWKEQKNGILQELADKLAGSLREDLSASNLWEFKIGFVKGSKIEIRPRDHNPPHFHVDYAGKQASYSIRTGELLRGKLPNKAHKTVKRWYGDNKDRLFDLWDDSRSGVSYVGEGGLDMSSINYPDAIKTLSALANGVDSQTGELLAKDHVFNQPDVIRSLFAAIESLKADRRRQRKRQALPERVGHPWTDEESEKLRKEFHAGKSTKVISQGHQRTKGAIRSQLVKLGLLQNVN